MLLIGMFDSPFVRRVAVSMKLLEIPFEHANWSVGRDFDRIREYNPLGRVPTLVTNEGERLMESAAILDYLDELVGPERALLPHSGPERRQAQGRVQEQVWVRAEAGEPVRRLREVREGPEGPALPRFPEELTLPSMGLSSAPRLRPARSRRHSCSADRARWPRRSDWPSTMAISMSATPAPSSATSTPTEI